MTKREYGRLVDPVTERFLSDVGLPGFTLAESVDADGIVDLWVVDRDQLGIEGADHGNELPPHELIGPLPSPWWDRIVHAPIRCGRLTRAGQPCRVPVGAPGHACAHHRDKASR